MKADAGSADLLPLFTVFLFTTDSYLGLRILPKCTEIRSVPRPLLLLYGVAVRWNHSVEKVISSQIFQSKRVAFSIAHACQTERETEPALGRLNPDVRARFNFTSPESPSATEVQLPSASPLQMRSHCFVTRVIFMKSSFQGPKNRNCQICAVRAAKNPR